MVISVNDSEFLLQTLRKGKRLDGRSIYALRPVEISFPSADLGTVECRMGKTRVLAKVSCEPLPPHPDRPVEGFVKFQCDISPMASPEIDPTARQSSDDEIILGRTLEKLLKSSRAIDTEGLCIAAGRLVWSVRVDLHVLDHDGDLVGCASVATIAALLHFRRPDVTVVGDDEITIHPLGQRNPVPLTIHHIPICISFATYDSEMGSGGDGGKEAIILVDPAEREELVRSGGLLVGINTYKELCLISKYGGMPLPMDKIAYCTELAFNKATELCELIQRKVKDDLRQRNVMEHSFALKSKSSK